MNPKHPPGPAMTLGNMRELGVRGLNILCLDPKCGHEVTFSVDDYADEIEVPSFAARIVCNKCGGERVAVRPNWKERLVMATEKEAIERAIEEQGRTPEGHEN